MKEIKAYLRPGRMDAVVAALRQAGIRHMTVTHVKSLGTGVDPKHLRVSFETGTEYTETTKLEFVCAADDVDTLLPLIELHARTGEPGDGVIFVAPVERAVKIRTGQEGYAALR